MPFSPLRLLLLAFLLAFVVVFVQLGVLTLAFGKLGLSADSAYLLFLTTLAASMLNIPLFSLPTGARDGQASETMVVAVNVGGCVVPVAFCIYLLAHNPLAVPSLAAEVFAVSCIGYFASRQIPGIGIGMPLFLAPVVAALCAMLLDPLHPAPLAYVGGTLGVLIGSDLLHLPDVRKMGAPFASIGGAGTFDGVFITGIVAVLLA